MAEPTEFRFSHKEVVIALIKQQGLHEGRWALAVQFGLAASNIGTTSDNSDLNPAAIIPIVAIGLRATTEISNLTVDAAEVNPATKGGKKKG